MSDRQGDTFAVSRQRGTSLVAVLSGCLAMVAGATVLPASSGLPLGTFSVAPVMDRLEAILPLAVWLALAWYLLHRTRAAWHAGTLLALLAGHPFLLYGAVGHAEGAWLMLGVLLFGVGGLRVEAGEHYTGWLAVALAGTLVPLVGPAGFPFICIGLIGAGALGKRSGSGSLGGLLLFGFPTALSAGFVAYGNWLSGEPSGLERLLAPALSPVADPAALLAALAAVPVLVLRGLTGLDRPYATAALMALAAVAVMPEPLTAAAACLSAALVGLARPSRSRLSALSIMGACACGTAVAWIAVIRGMA